MRILFLQKRPLFPANTGGKIRTLNVLRHLAKWHEITYLCNYLSEEKPYLHLMRELGLVVVAFPWREARHNSVQFYLTLARNLTSRYPYTVDKDFDPRIRAKVTELLDGSRFDLLICDFVQMARNVIGIRSVPKLLFQHNVEAQIYRRLADNESNWFKRWFIRRQQCKMEAFERNVGPCFQQAIAVSQQDRRIFMDEYGWPRVRVIDTAVDTEFFCPMPTGKVDGRIAFIGSMDWRPNQEGMLRFVKQVFPLIQKYRPEVSLDIVGRNPPANILKLGNQPGVTVTGQVEDVRPFIARACVTVVPIYSGGGTRLKIFESMAMGTPVVSTSLGADGLKIEDGLHWICADSDESFAAAVGSLLADKERREAMGILALHHVREHFGSQAIARQFEEICKETANAGRESFSQN